jgi:hypothetical protein
MKKIILPVVILLCFICSGCSKSADEEQEKSSMGKFTEKTGREAAEALKQPINKAKDADRMAQERMKDLEKQDAQKGE